MNILMPYAGEYASAKSASEDIDIDAILAGCDAVDEEASKLSELSSEYFNTGNELNEEILSVDGATMHSTIEECCTSITSAQEGILGSTAQIRETAVAAYNSLQQKYNEQAMAENERRAVSNG